MASTSARVIDFEADGAGAAGAAAGPAEAADPAGAGGAAEGAPPAAPVDGTAAAVVPDFPKMAETMLPKILILASSIDS
jgi:hypothetical protein